MSQGHNLAAPTVLVLEAEPSLRRLIVLGLEHQGLHVIAASSLDTLVADDLDALDLLVLDIDGAIASSASPLPAIHAHAHLSTLPIIILSWEKQPSPQARESRDASTALVAAPYTYIAKPFDARALYTAIAQQLRHQAELAALAEARAEELLYARSAAAGNTPTIWPFVTAVGLLLAVFGFLLQFAIAIVGILVVITALLLWTLGSARPQPLQMVLE